ncbi:MAG TPA: methyl-accepting chemotaxis protein, partial [Thermodesulfobacteriota bacterium]|nr:methyl-accepting chemotaxis protein [Thermodesulfobacteriota bacterium]
ASSKTLADGSSAQAAGLEEASSSLEEMSSMTRKNAENANEAKNLTGDAKQIVENVNRHMTDMSEAIAEVLRSSEETKKIIKTIDEIYFQTNLLALNAAVEAARAGEAGAGFAVVADEVRNLAIRATEAAKNTSALIERTLKSVKNGSELTLATKEAFGKNVEVTEKIRSLIEEIAVASGEQAEGIAQVSRAVADMDKVTQTNAASAEESASAAEQLNGQAERVKEIVEKLARLVRGQRRAGLPGVLSDRKDSN